MPAIMLPSGYQITLKQKLYFVELYSTDFPLLKFSLFWGRPDADWIARCFCSIHECDPILFPMVLILRFTPSLTPLCLTSNTVLM